MGRGGEGWGGLVRGEEMACFFCLPDAIRHQHGAGACIFFFIGMRVRKHGVSAIPGQSERGVG